MRIAIWLIAMAAQTEIERRSKIKLTTASETFVGFLAIISLVICLFQDVNELMK